MLHTFYKIFSSTGKVIFLINLKPHIIITAGGFSCSLRLTRVRGRVLSVDQILFPVSFSLEKPNLSGTISEELGTQLISKS